MSSPTVAALSRRPKYISDSNGIGANMGIGRDWVEPNVEPQLKPAGGESELLAELLRILDRKQREGAAGVLERIPTGPLGGLIASLSPDTYANMADTDLGGEVGNAANAPDAMMLALGGGVEQAGLRRQSASPASDALVQQLMKGVQPASSNSLVSSESAPEWMRTAASGSRKPMDKGLASQIAAEREMARNRAKADDINFGYTKPSGEKVPPGALVRFAKDIPEARPEKFAAEVTITDKNGDPVTFNIWRDPDGGHYAQVLTRRTSGGFQDSYKAENLGEMQQLKQKALEAFNTKGSGSSPKAPVEPSPELVSALAAKGPASGGSDTIRVYSGGTSAPSDFWSENPGRAASFGPNVWVVEIPRSVFEAGKAQAAKLGQPTKWDTVLPNEWVKKSSQVPSENLGR